MALDKANIDFGRSDYNESFLDGEPEGADLEPVFLLRGQDPAAAAAVRKWVSMAKDYGVNPDMLKAANVQADRMARYAEGRGRKPADVQPGQLPR